MDLKEARLARQHSGSEEDFARAQRAVKGLCCRCRQPHAGRAILGGENHPWSWARALASRRASSVQKLCTREIPCAALLYSCIGICPSALTFVS